MRGPEICLVVMFLALSVWSVSQRPKALPSRIPPPQPESFRFIRDDSDMFHDDDGEGNAMVGSKVFHSSSCTW
jgi:hypothetical protein